MTAQDNKFTLTPQAPAFVPGSGAHKTLATIFADRAAMDAAATAKIAAMANACPFVPGKNTSVSAESNCVQVGFTRMEPWNEQHPQRDLKVASTSMDAS